MKIEQLIQLSPVPVEFVDTLNNSHFAGAYYHAKEYAGKPRIKIVNELDNNEKMVTLIHEIAHAKCDAKGCKCMKNPDRTVREYHANKFTLTWLLKHKQKELLKQEMDVIIGQANGLSNYEYYVEAAKHIMKLKLWHKCLNYIK